MRRRHEKPVFGDINDYGKYGLLRVLSNHGEIATVVCRMLTPDDTRTDNRPAATRRRPCPDQGSR